MYKSQDRSDEMGRDWSYHDEGPFTDREWVPGNSPSDPVSHSGGRPLRLEVSLLYTPVRDTPLCGYVEGVPDRGSDRAFRFSSDSKQLCRLTRGRNKIVVCGEEPLQNWPGQREVHIRWTFRNSDDTPLSLGVSGPHKIFITFDAPQMEGKPEDGPSVTRMQEATRRVQEIRPCSPPYLLQQLFDAFPHYVLGPASLPSDQQAYLGQDKELRRYMRKADWPRLHPRNPEKRARQGGAWPLADLQDFGGECQAIVRFLRGLAMQLGLPGTIELKYVTADFQWPEYAIVSDRVRGVSGPGQSRGKDYAFVDRPVERGELHGLDSEVGFNNYEAYMRYFYPLNSGRTLQGWYGGGIGRNVAEFGTDLPSEETRRKLLTPFWGIAQYQWEGSGTDRKMRITDYHSYNSSPESSASRRPFSWARLVGRSSSAPP